MPGKPATTLCETEIDFLARTLIAQHGEDAPLAAEHHLDQLMAAGSSRYETWVAVIDAIHVNRCRQRSVGAFGAVIRAWQSFLND
ncbi:MAG TPA: hypothetical protein VK432_10055 [Stellaceae bacterium]|nr:hypothetical protein [Stellaceae bacterium]